jgi:hypothetical protein
MKDCVSLLATSIHASPAVEENDDLFGSHLCEVFLHFICWFVFINS